MRLITAITSGSATPPKYIPNRKPDDWWKAIAGWSEVPVVIEEWAGRIATLNLAESSESDATARLGAAWNFVDYPQLVRHPRTRDFERGRNSQRIASGWSV